MNIVILIVRVLFGLLGAAMLYGAGQALLAGLHMLPGVPVGAETPAFIFGAVTGLVGAALVFTNIRNVRAALFTDGAVSILLGGVWFLQGLNMFPGQSFMNGDIKWTYIGGALALVGVGLVVLGIRRKA